MTVQKAGVAALPFLLNPATVGVVAIGALGWGLFKLFGDEDEEATEDGTPISQEPQKSKEPFMADAAGAVKEEVQKDTGAEAFSETSTDDEGKTDTQESADEEEQQEIVRQAMSALGKRSAAARARRKAAASEGLVIGGE
ncbi:hypothetical protein DL239_06775 [Sedimentitalea sp. CY04]|uniref:Uncharacterized protein n=1 Tax=Parasedimentitalea denitrificans TaxID=2211118 RepID=A0ABX0W520_9RHOB|nr:hypothetical protein [Sedimentitalea sp. CY04]NIZ60677.1 hypothetical protein [Sedimentitalea sp. CY04]